MLVRILGLHPVPEAPDPCHLIEIELAPAPAHESVSGFDATAITQVVEDQPRSAWQRPMDLHLLDHHGQSGSPLWDLAARAVAAPARLVFFFHFLHLERPLLTPAGPCRLPAPSGVPARLSFMHYA